MSNKPDLKNSLAYVVLMERQKWLGDSSPSTLNLFLNGAFDRAEFTGKTLPCWRVYGPLADPNFHLPIVAETGHPTLAIRCYIALEFLHFSQEDAAQDLLKRMREFVVKHGLDTTLMPLHKKGVAFQTEFRRMARRPGMYLGDNRGWSLRTYLAGMDAGGDWLGLPKLPGLRKAIRTIESRSKKSYGSTFAAYRVYDAASLLGWAGFEPAEDVKKTR